MKRYCIVATGAILLLIAAGLFLFDRRPWLHHSRTAPIATTPAVAFDCCPGVAWKRYRVSIGGRSLEFEARQYPQRLAFRDAVHGATARQLGMQSAIGAMFQGIQADRQVKGRADIESLSRFFDDDPTNATAWFQKIQSQVGGWDAYAGKIRKSAEKEWSSLGILGEARMGPYHVFVVSAPDMGEPTFRPLRRLANGEYRHMQDLDENIRPLLYNSRLLQIWEKPEPGRRQAD